MTDTATVDDAELAPIDPRHDPLCSLTSYDNVFALVWRAERTTVGEGGEPRVEALDFRHFGQTAGEVLERVAAEIVRQDADGKGDWERSFSGMREVGLVSSEEIGAEDLEGTMAFRLRREARAREAKRQALAAERAKDPEKERRRAAYEELKAEFEGERTVPEPEPPSVTDPAQMAAQAEMLAQAERAAGERLPVTWYDLSSIGQKYDVDGDSLVADLIGRGYIRDLGVANSGGIFHGERMVGLAAKRE